MHKHPIDIGALSCSYAKDSTLYVVLPPSQNKCLNFSTIETLILGRREYMARKVVFLAVWINLLLSNTCD